MMKILVTGGTGYIGSHTVVELLENGYEVLIVDSLYNSSRDVLENLSKITGRKPLFEQFDLCDAERTAKLFRDHRDIKAVIHFAAFKSVNESVRFPVKYYRNNLDSTSNILQGMLDNQVRYIAFSSSCTVYGKPEVLPVTEKSPLRPAESPYGNTKKIMEDMIRDVCRSSDMVAASLRYFNPIGAHPSALIGEAPSDVPDNLVPYLTQTAMGIRPFLRVFGNDYDTLDGTPIRDYLHVVDLAKAHVAALKRMLEGRNQAGYEVFNLGTGKGNTVMEVISSFERVSGMKLQYQVVGRREGDIEKVWADTTLANRELGWKATRTLDDMMLSAWNWEKKRSASKK